MIVESCLEKGSLCSCNIVLDIYKNNAGNNLEFIKNFCNVASKRSKWKTIAGTGVK